MKRERYIHKSETMWGTKISEYGLENGYVDYGTIRKTFDMILCNNIAEDYEYLELVSGSDYDEEKEEYIEIFQYWIISDECARELIDILPDEIIYYNSRLDVHIWGITHFGTSWDYVLTDCKIELNK